MCGVLDLQHVVAEALGLPANKIVCRVKRMGKSFIKQHV